MKGRHVVILVFVFGLSLMAILFRVLPGAKPAAVRPAPDMAQEGPVTPPPQIRRPQLDMSGEIEVLVKSKGAPVQGAAVSLQFLRGDRMHQLATNAQGMCSVPRAEPGPWRIVARASDAATAIGETTVEVDRKSRVELEVAVGSRIHGEVRDGAGNVVPGAKVAVSLPDPAFSTRTDPAGRYSIADVPPGTHTVTVSSDRLRPQVKSVTLATPGQSVPLDFMLQEGAFVAGRVLDETGAPVGRAMITVSNEVARVVRSDEEGNFRAEGLGEGPITIQVTARGFARSSVTGVPPGDLAKPVTLFRGATLMGRIEETPPPAFSVHLSRFDETLQKWQVERSESFGPDSNGSFQVRELPPGRYEAVVETSKKRTPTPRPFQLTAGQVEDGGLFVLADK